jgi:hypothetical protein
MKTGRRSLGLIYATAVVCVVSTLLAPTAASGSRAPVGQRREVRMVLRAGGGFSTSGRYRSSLQPPTGSRSPIAARSAGATSGGRSTAAPTSLSGFAGIAYTGNEPSDTIGALGATHYLTAVNTRYALWNRDGTEAIAPTRLTSLTSRDDGMFVFDPKIVYDAHDDTFVLVYLALRNSPKASLIVITAIPDATADDPDTWCTSSIHGDQRPGDRRTWADYPTLGFDQNRVTLATNEFTFPSRFGRFAYSQVISFPKARLYDCTTTLIGTVFAGAQTRNPDGSKAFTIQPAQTVGASDAPQYLLSFEGPRRHSRLIVWRIASSNTGLRLTRAAIDVGRVRGFVVGTQLGAPNLRDPNFWWDTGDQRLINAWYDSDRGELFAAHDVAKDLRPDTRTGGYLESAIRWYEVDPAGQLSSSTLARMGIVGAPETDAGWPAVATDGSGNLFITFSRASKPRREYLSAWAAEIPPGTRTAALQLLVEGTAVHDAIAGIERWGDFNGIGRDPTDPSQIAMINQIAVRHDAWLQTVTLVTDG